MTKNTRFSPEVRQRAVRMVLESQGEYDSQWATICSIAPKIGCTPETLRVWVRQHERDTGGGDGGLTTAERQRLASGSNTFSAPLITVISSGSAVLKVYSPSTITPTLARPVLLLEKPIDFTLPEKYSLL